MRNVIMTFPDNTHSGLIYNYDTVHYVTAAFVLVKYLEITKEHCIATSFVSLLTE